MAMNHEDTAVQLHSTFEQRTGSIGNRQSVDMTGAKLPIVETEKGSPHAHAHADEANQQPTPDDAEPTDHEKKTLRHVGDKFPASAYLIAVVELCERFTCKPWLLVEKKCCGRLASKLTDDA